MKTKCIESVAGKTSAGYPVVYFEGKQYLAHRVAYVSAKGQIGNGLEIDHLCKNKSCVNPNHLEAVTHRINILRSNAPPAINFKKKECNKGHTLTKENVYVIRNRRVCKKCSNSSGKNYRRKIKIRKGELH